MAAVFIDPSEPTNGDGSVGAPFNTWESVTFENSSFYFQKAGTAENINAFGTIVIDTKTSVSVTTYGTGAPPIVQNYRESTNPDDWSEGDSNVWEYVHGVAGGVNGSYVLGLGELGENIGARVSYDDSGGSVSGWTDYGDFSNSKSALSLYVYSDQNPVTKWGSIFWGVFTDRCFQFKNCDTTAFDGYHLKNAVQGLAITVSTSGTPHGSGTYWNITTTQCDRGVYLDANPTDATRIIENADIHSITTRETGGPGISFYADTSNCRIYSCDIDTWGQTESSGAIYGRNNSVSGEELEIYLNTIVGGTYGKYWNDGDGIYIDNGSTGVSVFRNDISDLPDLNMAALRDNSGGARILFYSNRITNCDRLAAISDSSSQDAISTGIYHNIGIGLTDGIYIASTADVGTITLDNNILVGTTRAIESYGDVTFDHTKNVYYGYSNTTGVEAGAILTDPGLFGYKLDWDSAIIDAGVAITPTLVDYEGTTFPFPVNLGAYVGEAGYTVTNEGNTGATYDGAWTSVDWSEIGDNTQYYPMHEGIAGGDTFLAYNGKGQPLPTHNAVIQNYTPQGWSNYVVPYAILEWAALGSENLATGGVSHQLDAQFLGTGTPTFTVDSYSLLPDWEGNYYRIVEDTAPWHGPRLVENWSRASDDVQGVGWTTTTGVSATGPDTVTFDGTAGQYIYNAVLPDAGVAVIPAGGALTLSVEMKSAVVTTIGLAVNASSVWNTFDDDALCSLTSTWQRFAVTVINTSGSVSIINYCIGDVDKAGTTIGGVSGAVNIRNVQCEGVTGRSNQNPGEYVAKPGTTNAPVQAFYGNQNGNTVDVGNVVSEAAGGPLSDQPWIYTTFSAFTNSLFYSTDQTSWAVSAGTDVQQNAVGLKAWTNECCTITDDSAANYEYVSQTRGITSDSNPRTLRTIIPKDTDESRMIGVQLNLENGTTEPEIGLSVNTKTGAAATWTTVGTVAYEVNDAGAWWEVNLQVDNNGTGNNEAVIYIYPAVGTVLGTPAVAATGSVVIINCELHNNKTIPEIRGVTPIVTAGASVTAAAVLPTYDIGNHDDLNGGYFIEWKSFLSKAEHAILGVATSPISINGTYSSVLGIDTAGLAYTYDGTNTPTQSGAWSAGENHLAQMYLTGGDLRVNLNGVWSSDPTFDGAFDSGISLNIGIGGKTVNLYRNARRYSGTWDEITNSIESLLP